MNEFPKKLQAPSGSLCIVSDAKDEATLREQGCTDWPEPVPAEPVPEPGPPVPEIVAPEPVAEPEKPKRGRPRKAQEEQ